MRKISNWENITESTSFKRLAPGGYIVKLLNVEDHPDKEYLRISFDIVEGDEKGYFKKQYDNDKRPERKWPNAGSFIRSYKDSAASMFKGFTGAVERSNKGYVWNFEEKTLVGKLVGLIIADEQYQNQKGQIRERNYVAAIRSVDIIKKGEFDVPPLKELDGSKVQQTTAKSAPITDPFANDAPAATEPTPDYDNPWGGDDESNPFA